MCSLRLAVLSLVALGLLFISRAQASDVRASLLWQRPPDSHCPAGTDLEADVESVVGRPVFAAQGEADVTVRGSIEERADGVHVQIEATARDGVVLGTRRLDAPAGQCASLRGAITLVLIVLLDSVAAHPEIEPAAASAGTALGVWTGLVPRVSWAPALSFWIAPRPALALQAEASYWLPVDVETARGLGVRFQAIGMALRVCPKVAGSWQGHSLALCAGPQLGGMFSAPHSLDGPERQARLLAQGLLELRARLGLRTFALEAALGMAANFARPRFSYERSDASRASLFQADPLGLFFSLGVIKL